MNDVMRFKFNNFRICVVIILQIDLKFENIERKTTSKVRY